MKHQHQFDAQGKQICCTEEEKIYTNAGASKFLDKKKAHSHSDYEEDQNHDHHDDDGRDHSNLDGSVWKLFLPSIVSLLLLLIALYFDHFLKPDWFTSWVSSSWYVVAYLPVGLPVLKEAVKCMFAGGFYSEFFLMGVATLGAFGIGEYPEGVAVMLFYSGGEVFQTLAVSRAQADIKSLLDQRPDEVTILRNNKAETVNLATRWEATFADVGVALLAILNAVRIQRI